MKVLREKDKSSVKEIDAMVKNKWSWKWCEEVVTFELDNGKKFQYKLGDCIVKIDVSGVAYCQWCEDKLCYSGNGKRNLLKHCQQGKHNAHVKTRASNYTLGGMFSDQPSSNKDNCDAGSGKTKKFFPIFNSRSTKAKGSGQTMSLVEEPPSQPASLKPLIPLKDRTANMEAMILSYMAEYSLPLSLSSSLVELITECSRDPQALAGVSLSKTSASYKTEYGIGKTMLDETVELMRAWPFSLSADESTTCHGKRVLTIIVNLKSETDIPLVQHLASIELEKVDSESIYKVIESVMEENCIPWRNLVSALFDSCNVMRGCRNGVEVRLKEKAPHLLDIDGDSCHHVHNVVKTFCKPFNSWLEVLFTDLHMDFKYCTQHKKLMRELCRLGGIQFTIPQRFVSHRWLSVYDRAMDTARLLEVYALFYWAYVPVHQQGLYRNIFEYLLSKIPTAKARQHALQIISVLRGKALSQTAEGKARKLRIIQRLFENQTKTLVLLNIYLSILQIFKGYVLQFQKKETLIHKLSSEQEKLTRTFLACFIKSPIIKSMSITELSGFSLCEDNLLDRENLFVGATSKQILCTCDDEKMVADIYSSIFQAYTSASSVLLKKLPLGNRDLLSLRTLDPETNATQKELNTLIKKFFFFLSEDEVEDISKEVICFSVDNCLPTFNGVDVVSWWNSVKPTYPLIAKVASIAFTCFHGPQVEGTFNLMKDILDNKAGSMSINVLSSYQRIKYHLLARNLTSVGLFKREEILYTPVKSALVQNLCSSARRYKLNLSKAQSTLKREIATVALDKVLVNFQTNAAAKRIKEKALKKSLTKHQRRCDRNAFPPLQNPPKRRKM